MKPMIRSSASVLAALAAMLGSSVACSSAAPPSGTMGFGSEPLMTTTSVSGALQIDVRTSPQPPARGTNAVELTITEAPTNKSRDNLSIAVEPWMPAMNHGSSAVPTVTGEGDGKYLVTGVYLFMPGRWELRTSFSGTTTDHATLAFEIP